MRFLVLPKPPAGKIQQHHKDQPYGVNPCQWQPGIIGAEREGEFVVVYFVQVMPHRKEKKDRNGLCEEPMADIVEKGDVAVNDEDTGESVAGFFCTSKNQEGHSQGEA